MAEAGIPAEAQDFLSKHISSVAQLELLLLLRTNPQRAWPVSELVTELRVDTTWASQQLTELTNQGLLVSEDSASPTYRFRPATPALEQAVTAVAQTYLLHRVSVIEFIYSRPSESMRAFADAFRWRKEPPRG